MPTPNKLAALIATALAASCVTARSDASDMFSVSGYGTLGVVHSSEADADFAPVLGTPSGAGRTDRTSASPDTRVGLQVDARFSDKFSGTAQFVSELDEHNSYEPELVAANVKYQFTPAFSVTAGRFVAPFYMLSDFQRVGYAYTWVRPPAEVYNTAFNLDGASATYRFTVGSVALSAQAFYGHTETAGVIVDGMGGVTVQADFGASTIRAAHIRGSATVANEQLSQALALYRPAFGDLADQYEIRGDDVRFTALGYSYDPGSWFLKSEVTRVTGEPNLLGKTTRLFVGAGARFDKFTPYATFAKVKMDSALTLGAGDPIGIINGALAGTNVGRKSYTLGARWDFRTNMDLKLEFTHSKNDSGSNGDLRNTGPGFVPGRAYNLVSVSYDFVF
jgi:hypothetical protein